MTKISVIMPVHDTKVEWLQEAVKSILNQTFTDFEFIIIDDSSTNIQENVIKEFEDERINYQKLEPLSLPDALNYGINLAKGEYIARMDADDISLKNRFEKQVEFLDNNLKYSIVGSWFEIFPKKTVVKHPKTPKLLDFAAGCCIGHPTVMFRKADFDKYNLRYSNEYYCEDYDLWSRALRHVDFYNIQEILLFYREEGVQRSQEGSIQLTKDSEKIRFNILECLTSDEVLQKKLLELMTFSHLNVLQRIFSVRELFSNHEKRIVIRILGLKISIKEKK